MTNIQEQIDKLEKQKKDLEEKQKILDENERINDLKINGYSKLKDFNLKADKYLKLPSKKQIHDLTRTVYHTKPRFELIYDLFLIQQERINFLEEKIKQLEKNLKKIDTKFPDLLAINT